MENFTFTAFSGSSIINEAIGNLLIGASFTLPFSADANFSVTDNDSRISGDSRRNEVGNDRTGQRAEIEVNGVVSQTNAKIYAEETYTLQDANGNLYELIEIEIAGQSTNDRGDFFAFSGPMPPAGTTLTVVDVANVSRGDAIQYDSVSAGLNWSLDDEDCVVIEAEDLQLSGYTVQEVGAASGDELIRLNSGTGEASLVFGAVSGSYDLELAIVDENDGVGTIDVLVNGVFVQQIVLDQQSDGNGINITGTSTVTVPGLALNQGDEITLRGTRDFNEFVRIDSLKFTAADEVNSGPVADGEIQASVSEDDAALTIDLLEGATDVDGDNLSVTNVSVLPAGIALVGNSLQVDPSDASFQSLSLGETREIAVSYQIIDGNGGVVDQVANVTVVGTNDEPTVNGSLSTAVNEDDGDVVVSLLDGSADIDGDVLTVSNVTGLVPGITLSDDNASLIISSSDDAFQSLAAGEILEVPVAYQISDGNGGLINQTAAITVTGTNDAPVFESQVSVVVTVNGDDTQVDLLEFASDVDGDTLSVVSVDPIIDGISVTGNILTVDADNSAFQSLAAGETVSYGFSYTVSDGNGGLSVNDANVVIEGVNDDPTVTGPLVESVFEDGQNVVLDLLRGAEDIDGDDLTVNNVNGLVPGIELVGNQIVISPSDDAFQSLAVGEVQEISIDYQIEDGNGGVVDQVANISVTGTNDFPVVGDFEIQLPEDLNAQYTIDLLQTSSDIDGDELSIVDFDGLVDGLSITGNGLFLDTRTDTFQSLSEGEVGSFDFSITVSDGNGGTVITSVDLEVTGSNDLPIINGTTFGIVKEDEQGVANGLLTIQDIDDGEAFFQEIAAGTIGDNGLGTFELTQDGAWSYTLDNDSPIVQGLGDNGKVLTDTITATSLDGSSTQSINITITGTDDLPTIGGLSTGFVVEDDGSTFGEKVIASDGAQGDRYGESVSISDDGSLFVVGSRGSDQVGAQASGAAYLYNNDGEELAKLTASDATTSDGFGFSAAVSGDGSTIVIGAESAGLTGFQPGAVYIFDSDGTEIQKLIPSGDPDFASFGYNVATSFDGNVIVVGAPDTPENGVFAGAAYIFDRNGNEIAKLIDPDGDSNDQFGGSVAVSADGNTIVVGAFYDDTFTGSAFIFDGAGNQIAKVEGLDREERDNFSFRVAISGDGELIAIGAPGDNGETEISGSVTLYDRSGTEITTITPPDTDGSQNPIRFGNSVDISADGSTIIVGSSGVDRSDGPSSAQAFVFDQDGNKLAQLGALDDEFSTISLNSSVSVSGDGSIIVLGAVGDSQNGSSAGAAYTFVRDEDGNYVDRAGNIFGPDGVIGQASEGPDPATGLLTIDDIDNSLAAFQEIAAGTIGDNGLGTFELTEDGAWSYTLDNDNPLVQALDQGDFVVDTISAQSNDGTVAQEIAVTIQGVNEPGDEGDILIGVSSVDLVIGRAAGDIQSDEATMTLSDDAFIISLAAGESDESLFYETVDFSSQSDNTLVENIESDWLL